MPALGFAPDAEFPAIHGEKGITTFDLVQNVSSPHTDHSEATLLSFESGQRYNMVPDHAKAHILVEKYDRRSSTFRILSRPTTIRR